MEQIVHTFSLGKSVVVTIPKVWGVKPGTSLKGKKQGQQIIFRRLRKVPAVGQIRHLAGGMNFQKVFGKSLEPHGLNELVAAQYEELLPRR